MCFKIQTWLLYHNALSEGVLIDTILKQARRSQQAEEAEETSQSKDSVNPEMIEMRRLLDEQSQVIKHLTRSMHAQQTHPNMSSGKVSKSKSDASSTSKADTNTRTSSVTTISPKQVPMGPMDVPLPRLNVSLETQTIESTSQHPVSPPAQEVIFFSFCIFNFRLFITSPSFNVHI